MRTHPSWILVSLLSFSIGSIGCDAPAGELDGGTTDAWDPNVDAGDGDGGPACTVRWGEGIEMNAPSLDPEGVRAATCALNGLRDAVATRRVICSAENDHGVAQASVVHGLLARYLALEHGMRVVAIEATEAGVAHWDRYLETGDEAALAAGFNDARGSLADIQEYERLLGFLREVSAELPAGERLRIVGFDVAVQTIETRRALVAYVERVAPADAAMWRTAITGSDFEAVGDGAEALYARLGEREAEYVAASDREAWERARRDALNMRDGARFMTYYAAGNFEVGNATYREPGMVRNIEDLLARIPTEDPVMLIAHRMHCARNTIIGVDASGAMTPSFGTHLARSEEWGPRYLVVAQLYANGASRGAGDDTHPFTLRSGTLEAAIAEITTSEAMLLGAPTTRVDMNAEYRANMYDYPPDVPAEQVDGVVWLRDVTPTTPR